MRERPNNERCNLCDEWHKEGIENYAEHLKSCKHSKVNAEKDDKIDSYSCRGQYLNYYEVRVAVGLKQSLAVYIRYAQTEYFRGKVVQITRVGALVSLASFYDMGRLPLHLGGDYGRVMWVALAGSKWINFRTWDSFRWQVLDRDNGKCKRCGKIVAEKCTEGQYAGLWKNDAEFVCDHIMPLCRDGKDWWEDPEMLNFQTLCVECNKIKTKEDMASYRANERCASVIGVNGFTLDKFSLVGADET
jgi:hypothetical protein